MNKEAIRLLEQLQDTLAHPEEEGRVGDVPGGEFNPVSEQELWPVNLPRKTPTPRTPGEVTKGGATGSEFEKDLTSLINRYSLENETNVPDFILADYLIRCLESFRHTVQWTHNWFEGSEWRNPRGLTSERDQTAFKKGK